MEITLHKKDKYLGCNVYVRRMGTMFEYMAVIRGEIYSQQVIFKPTLTGRFMHRMGVWKTVYSDSHLKSSVFYMMAMAQTTVETILHVDDKGNKIKKPTVIEIKESDVAKFEK